MLVELHIKNIAIIEEQRVEFGAGFNVISGETGAGKSIILQSLDLVLGGKPSARLVRAGAKEAEITALLSVPTGVLADFPEYSESEEIVITRTVPSEGRSKISINGRPATAQLLQEIATRLITICGQNQHARLLEPKFHITLVDDFATAGALLDEYREAYRAYTQLNDSLAQMKRQLERADSRRAELELVIADLSTATLAEGRRVELESEISRLSNAERILTTAERVRAALGGATSSSGSEGGPLDGGILEALSTVQVDLDVLCEMDPRLHGTRELFETAYAQLSEIESGVDRYASSVELNEEALELAREELALIARLERKYKTNETGLIALKAKATEELQALGDDASCEALAQQTELARKKALQLADQLSKVRVEAAARLSAAVEKELGEVNLPRARLALDRRAVDLGPNGIDAVEFLFSTNKGEPLKPLREIASGGELSRVMLVLKKLLRDRTGVSVLVFDEVDTGISGKVARAVGEKLRSLAQDSQVLCITHLAQVASLADKHFLVEKLEVDRTLARVRALTNEERIEEVARMLAGFEITPAARESARELIAANW